LLITPNAYYTHGYKSHRAGGIHRSIAQPPQQISIFVEDNRLFAEFKLSPFHFLYLCNNIYTEISVLAEILNFKATKLMVVKNAVPLLLWYEFQ
jgi:hypothetical protein